MRIDGPEPRERGEANRDAHPQAGSDLRRMISRSLILGELCSRWTDLGRQPNGSQRPVVRSGSQ